MRVARRQAVDELSELVPGVRVEVQQLDRRGRAMLVGEGAGGPKDPRGVDAREVAAEVACERAIGLLELDRSHPRAQRPVGVRVPGGPGAHDHGRRPGEPLESVERVDGVDLHEREVRCS